MLEGSGSLAEGKEQDHESSLKPIVGKGPDDDVYLKPAFRRPLDPQVNPVLDVDDEKVDWDLHRDIKALLHGQRRVESMLQELAYSAGRQGQQDVDSHADSHVDPHSELQPTRDFVGETSARSHRTEDTTGLERRSAFLKTSGSMSSLLVLENVGEGSAVAKAELPEWLRRLELREELTKGDVCFSHSLTMGGMRTRTRMNSKGGTDISKYVIASESALSPTRSCPVFHPHGKFRMLLDLLTLVVLAYDMVSVPYFIAFDGENELIFLWLSTISVSFWTVDMLLVFRTGFHNQEGDYKTGQIAIARNYLRGAFWLDFALVSLDLSSFIMKQLQRASGGESVKLTRIFKFGKVVRLMSGFRVRRLRNILKKVGQVTSFLLETAQIVLLILWMNHLVACIWCFAGRELRDSSDTGVTWLDLHIKELDRSYSTFGPAYQYSTALHWAFTQMTPGSMQVFPMNTVERALNVVVLTAGLLVFSSIISSISGSVTNFKIQMQGHRAKMDDMRSFLLRTNVSPSLRISICEQVNRRLQKRREPSFHDLEVEKLPLSLKSALLVEICADHLLRHPFMSFACEADSFLWSETCQTCTQFSMLVKGENLFLYGQQSIGMYFITMGSLSYVSNFADPSILSCRSHSLEAKADILKHGRWLSEAAVWCHWRHVGHAEVTKSGGCEVLCLNADQVVKIFLRDSLLAQVACAYASTFKNFLENAINGVCETPTDVCLPFEPDEVIASMPQEASIALGQVAISILKHAHLSWVGAGINEKARDELIAQVNKGGSALLVTKLQGVVRCVRLVVVRLRRADGRHLCLLRRTERADGALEATCQLPGGKVGAGEHPNECLQRMLQDKLAPLEAGLAVVGVRKESYWDASGKFGVQTRYIRTVFEANWEEEKEDAGKMLEALAIEKRRPCHVDRTMSTSSPHVRSNLAMRTLDVLDATRRNMSNAFITPDGEVYRFPDGDTCAWLTQEEFAALSSKSNQRHLLAWMATFNDVCEEESDAEGSAHRSLSNPAPPLNELIVN